MRASRSGCRHRGTGPPSRPSRPSGTAASSLRRSPKTPGSAAMADPSVREIGRVEDMDGTPVVIGVDYDTVTIGTVRLTAYSAEGSMLRNAGVSWDVWRPDDLQSGRIQRELEAIR